MKNIYKIFVSIMILMATTSMVSADTNLVKNPGYEIATGSTPQYWYKHQTGTGAIFQYPDTGKVGKAVSIKYTVRQSGKLGIWSQDTASISPSTKYTLSGYMKLENVIGSGASIRISWRKSDGSIIRTDMISRRKGTSGWTYYQSTFTSPSNVAKATVGVDLYDASGKVYFDDISLVKGTGVVQNAKAEIFTNKGSYNVGENVEVYIKNTGGLPVWIPNPDKEPWIITNTNTGETIELPEPTCDPYGYGSCNQWIKLLSGQSTTQLWDQKDNSGVQVPTGSYMVSAKYTKQDPLSNPSPTMNVISKLFWISQPQQTTNLAPNPSFEDDLNNDNKPDKWFTNNWIGPAASYSWTTDYKYEDTKSVKILSNNVNTKARWMTDRNILVTPGKTYNFNAYVKTQGLVKGYMTITFWNSALVYVGGGNTNIKAGTNDWSMIQGNILAPSKAKYARIELRIEGKGTVWFDSVVLK